MRGESPRDAVGGPVERLYFVDSVDIMMHPIGQTKGHLPIEGFRGRFPVLAGVFESEGLHVVVRIFLFPQTAQSGNHGCSAQAVSDAVCSSRVLPQPN